MCGPEVEKNDNDRKIARGARTKLPANCKTRVLHPPS